MYVNAVELAIRKLSDAARRIDAVEHHYRRVPHASRLSPLRDISADIQRLNTPSSKVSGQMESKQKGDLALRMPDLWPWHDGDSDDGEHDTWANKTDPLLSRRFPNPAESARIEEEDMRRAAAEGLLAPSLPKRFRRNSRMRLAFFGLSLLAVLALIIDSILVVVAFSQANHRSVVHGPPILTLSTSVASYGQTVLLHIRNFYPDTDVYLTHDIHVPLQTSNARSLIRVDKAGSADVATQIGYNDWGSGFHAIEAEDVRTRYSANATLQVATGPLIPSHLQLKSKQLDFGSAIVGASTLRSFILSNSGTGAIAWAASSNQTWLMLTPQRGIFSHEQSIAIAAERVGLKPGSYEGTITFSSNVNAPETLRVQMRVNPLPSNAGPVLSVTPSVLSFSASDDGADPDLQLLVVSNPGSQPLSWSLASNSPTSSASQNSFLQSSNTNTNWLNLDRTTGVVKPGATNVIDVRVHSRDLLPGIYMNTLLFNSGQGALDGPQEVAISLTIQPACALMLSSGNMSFTGVMGRGNPSTQVLNMTISTLSSCSNGVAWRAISSEKWLTVTPSSGQLKGSTSVVMTAAVNTVGLSVGSHTALLSILTPKSTESVVVTLTMQSTPPPTAPLLGVSTLGLNFNTTQGQSDPPGQSVTITNSGGGTLQWQTQVTTLAPNWLHAGPTGGTIAPGQTAQLTVSVYTSGLTPGTYVGQIVLLGVDENNAVASGSPQTITVNLLVLPPCSLGQPSASMPSFNAMQGGANPAVQSLTITASGNCGWPLGWSAYTTSTATWLNISPASGTFSASGQSATISVAPSVAGLAPGTYSVQVAVTALDASNVQAQGSPQYFTATLTVQQPCALQMPVSSLSFTVVQGQKSSAQKLSWYETGTCTMPLSWSVSQDAGSAGWLTFDTANGTDSGSGGSTQVSANARSLTPGNYQGTLTISVSGNGAAVQSSLQTVQVNLTVTGFTISGVVEACVTLVCLQLPSATVNLLNSAGQSVQKVTTDSNGNFALVNVALGSYTITVLGINAAGIHLSASVSITVSGDQKNLVIQALAL
ncbi:MAG: hypothetical protein JO202_04415, partial [Ktedonobacteraceae bacterium]|nr:hypothetical protein [Ktedonobacteraceae bacterium]